MQPIRSLRQAKQKLAVGALLVGSLLAISFVVVRLASARGETEAAVQQVVMDALVAEHALPVLPKEVADTGLSDELRGQMVAAAQGEIDRLYTGPMAVARTETLVGGIKLEGTPDGIWVWDGGIKDVDFTSVLVDGDKAVVKVQATAYLVVSQFAKSERSYPENRADNTFELSLIDGRWMITSEDLDYLPGQAP